MRLFCLFLLFFGPIDCLLSLEEKKELLLEYINIGYVTTFKRIKTQKQYFKGQYPLAQFEEDISICTEIGTLDEIPLIKRMKACQEFRRFNTDVPDSFDLLISDIDAVLPLLKSLGIEKKRFAQVMKAFLKNNVTDFWKYLNPINEEAIYFDPVFTAGIYFEDRVVIHSVLQRLNKALHSYDHDLSCEATKLGRRCPQNEKTRKALEIAVQFNETIESRAEKMNKFLGSSSFIRVPDGPWLTKKYLALAHLLHPLVPIFEKYEISPAIVLENLLTNQITAPDEKAKEEMILRNALNILRDEDRWKILEEFVNFISEVWTKNQKNEEFLKISDKIPQIIFNTSLTNQEKEDLLDEAFANINKTKLEVLEVKWPLPKYKNIPQLNRSHYLEKLDKIGLKTIFYLFSREFQEASRKLKKSIFWRNFQETLVPKMNYTKHYMTGDWDIYQEYDLHASKHNISIFYQPRVNFTVEELEKIEEAFSFFRTRPNGNWSHPMVEAIFPPLLDIKSGVKKDKIQDYISDEDFAIVLPESFEKIYAILLPIWSKYELNPVTFIKKLGDFNRDDEFHELGSITRRKLFSKVLSNDKDSIRGTIGDLIKEEIHRMVLV